MPGTEVVITLSTLKAKSRRNPLCLNHTGIITPTRDKWQLSPLGTSRIVTEFSFVTALMPDYPAPTRDGIRLIPENFGKQYPDAPRSKGVCRWPVYRPGQKQALRGRAEIVIMQLPQVPNRRLK
jgi:hypothetical protein